MPYTQTHRLASLSTPLGADVFLLNRAHVDEAVSGMFTITLDVQSERDDLTALAVIGQPAEITLDLADGERRVWHGLVSGFAHVATRQRFASYRLEVRPWLWLLGKRIDSRIFQRQSVPEIVTSVFARAGQRDFELRLSREYPARIYCCQYRESDLAFVSRLLEDEGIFTFFVHEHGRHLLVLGDTPETAPPCAGPTAIEHRAGAGPFERDAIFAWEEHQTIHPGRCARSDYAFEDPGNRLRVRENTMESVGSNEVLEDYDHHVGVYGRTESGERHARLRMQEHEAHRREVRGRSDCRAMTAGHSFVLRSSQRPTSDGQRYLLTTVRHTLEQPAPFATGGDLMPATYANEFTCVPTTAPYGPRSATPRPLVHGPHTAVVVGPAGEEIHVDRHGRIKVQFHWDRLGRGDENSSCWLRVARSWAGNQWGAVSHPRVGDEVVVEFLAGDPDQPIVTGSVYNARRMPPYTLPANKTQSGIKTRSSPRGTAENYNELRFEDLKGKEHVFLQAEKDLQVKVKNDSSGTIGHDETGSVGHDQTLSVGNNRTRSVSGDESVTVSKSQTVQVGIDATEQVGATKLISAGDRVVIQAGTSITLQCGASTLHMNQAGVISLSGMLVSISGSAACNVLAPIANVTGGVLLSLNGAIATLAGLVTHVQGAKLARIGAGKVVLAAESECLIQGASVKLN